MSRFLARVFDADPQGWILKGGVGMMVRLPHARYSRDIDLMVASDAADPVAELRRVVRDHRIDHFRFEVGQPVALSNGKGARVTVGALLGGTTFDTFSIDIVGARRELVGPVERKSIPRLIDTDDFPPETDVQLYPLVDQIADKICAMYEIYGTRALQSSGRYRDLVDLLLVSMFLPISLRLAVAAVERERAARGIGTLPVTLTSPGPDWNRGWTSEAKKSPLASDHHDLETAIAVAGRCYNRILGSLPEVETGEEWSPERALWV
ncbi:nucleotidyl transferase AbiEii/AbiGii toxin family protein [Nocardia sp. NPDC058480]|uniref:nucleotidyl transferase AbiEii/AbiGii toxin family protein n=1 Tax=Nocardia sp. NPDC058480 TaxID=3346522 RepID=UPI003660C4D6